MTIPIEFIILCGNFYKKLPKVEGSSMIQCGWDKRGESVIDNIMEYTVHCTKIMQRIYCKSRVYNKLNWLAKLIDDQLCLNLSRRWISTIYPHQYNLWLMTWLFALSRFLQENCNSKFESNLVFPYFVLFVENWFFEINYSHYIKLCKSIELTNCVAVQLH